MTDKLNNLQETDQVVIGGYYRAGNHEMWDLHLTPGNLYLIRPVTDSPVDPEHLKLLSPDQQTFSVENDNGHVTFMSCLAAVGRKGALFTNPAEFK